jgi:hypothetical protein
MEHTYYFDGNEKMISWVIENKETKVEQIRTHVEDYYDKVSTEQSKIHCTSCWCLLGHW